MYTQETKSALKKLAMPEKLSLLRVLYEGSRRRGGNESESSYNSRIFAIDHELNERHQECVDAILDLLLDFISE